VNLDLLAKHLNLSRTAITNSVKLLKRSEIIDAVDDEPAHLTSIRFNFQYRNLDQIMSSFRNERKAAFVESLARLFGPDATNRMVGIETEEVLQFMACSANSLLKGLLVLKNDGIIDFAQSDHTLRISLKEPRHENLDIDTKLLYKYRDVLLRKVGFVDDFARSRSCRNRFLRYYFGDTDIPRQCGKCDVCAEKHPAGFF
jgi:hypothetical protein